MTRSILYLLAIWVGVTGLWLLVSPGGFHASIPGVAETGPLNTHLFRDVGLAFIGSALHHGPHGGPGELVATVLPGALALGAALRLRRMVAGTT